MSRSRSALLIVLVALLGTAVGIGAPSSAPGGLTCVDPLDAAGIDRVLTTAQSPLSGHGTQFVTASASNGLDPRLLVAISAHETMLATYGPAQGIHNPFGIGPHREFADYAESIDSAAELIARYYVAEGRTTIASIGPKWAPVGASNDPTDLNTHWIDGVSTYYSQLGGDPTKPVILTESASTCRSTDVSALTSPVFDPPAGLRVWDGREVTPLGPGVAGGIDPSTGLPATIAGFALPIAVPDRAVVIANTFADPALPGGVGCYEIPARCSTDLLDTDGLTVVAAMDGQLQAATQQEADQGIAFWLTAGEDRIGYSGLAAYANGVGDGVLVRAGQVVGSAASVLTVRWERTGNPLNLAPLLGATQG